MRQTTIKKVVYIEGVGLHTGKKVHMELHPAPSSTGIIFMRTDLAHTPIIKASLETVLSPQDYPRRTSIGRDNIYVHTVEHLLGVLSGLNIDNLLIKINAEEVPGLDGSGKKFVELIKEAGFKEQPEEKNYFIIKEPVYYYEGESLLAGFPYQGLKISYLLDYKHPLLKEQFIEFNSTPEVFEKEIASARTFCLEEEVDYLRSLGLGKGADYTNTLVVSKDGIIDNILLFKDEFARHKLLDLLGDLYLLGPIKGYIIAIRSGHSTNIEFIKRLNKSLRALTLGGVEAKVSIDKQTSLNIKEIMEILPHRYPFLFIDEILHLEPGRKAVGLKNVTINDYFFEGHFPGRPIMPGVLIIEAMAQTGGVLMLSLRENRGKFAYFMAANNVKFRKAVEPGDTLILEVEAKKIKSKTGIVSCRALVDNKIVAEAELYFALSSS